MLFGIENNVPEVLLFNIGVALGFLAFSKLSDPANIVERFLFSAVVFVSLALYLVWRAVDTLPPIELTFESIWQYIYFTFETISVVYALASIVILLRKTDRSVEADSARQAMVRDSRFPSVTVFICTYNEPLHILEKSMFCAKAMDYPNFNVIVCDDTRRQEVRAHCQAVGVEYLTRPDNKHAKAGNLDNALMATNASNSPSDLIMVLDADFAPQEDFLMRVAGMFRDPKIGLVQTPQFYFNSDPMQHNLGISRSFVDDQRVFFDTFQPAKDAVDCAFCVGTSFVVRRQYVNELGGFPHDALSEDMLLTYRLLEKGYVTRWLNEKLSVGLSAEGIPEYITQRTRWCLGTIQIGLLKTGPLWKGRFSLRQRLHYLHGLLNWLSKPFILCLLLAPSIYWFFDIPALQTDELIFMKYGISSLFIFWIYSAWISEGRTLPIFTEVTHALTALPVTVTLIQAARAPFGKPFKVTEKGGDRSRIRVHRPTALFFGAISILSATSILSVVFGADTPTELSPADILNLIWSAVAMVISFISLIVCVELPRVGQEELITTSVTTTARCDGDTMPVCISALSTEKMELSTTISVPVVFDEVLLPGLGWLRLMATGSGDYAINPDIEQKRWILRTLFRKSPGHIAHMGKLTTSIQSLLRRAFARQSF
jgi:cellulose synthase (UDP-forming)